MNIIRAILLILILWNLPSFGLFVGSPSLGSLLSYLTTGLFALYFLAVIKTEVNWQIITLALFYFVISGFQYYEPENFFIFELVKFFIFILGGYELVKRVNKEELLVILLVGSCSVAVDALFFPSKFGRYSGFYLNPNEAGFICIYGYALIYGIRNTSLKLFGQFFFTLMGLLTFSRTFIVIWLIVNFISLKISLRNLRILGLGILIFSTLILIDESVGLKNPRFQQLKNIANNKNVSIEEINEDSRVETWSRNYAKILESPFFGNGYGTLSGKLGYLGVHNSYLMIVGESGILPLLILLGYIYYLFYGSFRLFKRFPFLLMQTIALAMFLLTDHNLFTNYYILFLAMWIQYQIFKYNKDSSNAETHKEILNS